MRLMYDSSNPNSIPEHAQMVLVYVDGIYAPKWAKAAQTRFKYAQKVTCSAIGAVTAQVGDVELGCIWPVANAVPWVVRARRDGYDPTIYINERNDWGPCREAFRRAGVPEPHWFVANYDGDPDIPAGAVAKQFAHPGESYEKGYAPTVPWETGKHYDLSNVRDYWPGVDDAPAPGGGNTAPTTIGDDMVNYRFPATTDGNTEHIPEHILMSPHAKYDLVIATTAKDGSVDDEGNELSTWIGQNYLFGPSGADGKPVGLADKLPKSAYPAGGRVRFNAPLVLQLPEGTAQVGFEYSSRVPILVALRARP